MPQQKETNWSELIQARVLIFVKKYDGLLECHVQEVIPSGFLKIAFKVDEVVKTGWFAADDIVFIAMLPSASAQECDTLFMELLRAAMAKGWNVSVTKEDDFTFCVSATKLDTTHRASNSLLLASMTQVTDFMMESDRNDGSNLN